MAWYFTAGTYNIYTLASIGQFYLAIKTSCVSLNPNTYVKLYNRSDNSVAPF